MSDTATSSERYEDDLSTERDALLQAIAGLNEEQQRLTALESARVRAQTERWAASSQVSEAEAALRAAVRDEPQRAAYAFANGQTDSVSPVVAAQAAVDAANAEHQRLSQIEEVLENELTQLQNRLQRHQVAVNTALAAVVCRSEAFHQLLAELDAAWARLRGIRKAFNAIDVALHGHMPPAQQTHWQSMPSLDPLALRIPTDERFAAKWMEALEQLREDPDTELPQVR